MDESTYVEAASAIVEMGYDYVAIGGLARSNSRTITRILTSVSQAVGHRARIHVFGVARAALLPLLLELGVSSADSAAPLRQAWLAAKDNYYTPNGAFAAIRIPVATEGRGNSNTLVGRSKATYAELRVAEQEALGAARAFANYTLGIRATMKLIVAYDSMLGARPYESNTHERTRLYEALLADRPWERCPCPICKELGVEVAIFRGNNRNRRRGFHNLWVLRRRIQQNLGIEVPQWSRRRPTKKQRSFTL